MNSSDICEVLTHGTIEILGRISASSNQALLVAVSHNGVTLEACHKTELGERPLWDFPEGLWRREVAAYALAEFMGRSLIPETVVRHDGPYGAGSLQRWIGNATDDHYFTIRDLEYLHPWFRELAGFDFISNNTDRKSGHVLFDSQRCWAIDQGLCFAEEDKLRTVVWDFADDPLPATLMTGLDRVANGDLSFLGELISSDEIDSVRWRARDLALSEHLPIPDEDREWPPYPWPLI